MGSLLVDHLLPLSLSGLRSKKQASRAPVPRTPLHGHCYGRAVTCKEEVATLPTLTAVAAASRKPTTLQYFLELVQLVFPSSAHNSLPVEIRRRALIPIPITNTTVSSASFSDPLVTS